MLVQDKMENVTTPASEVTKVELSEAGATRAGGWPSATRIGDRIDPPPTP